MRRRPSPGPRPPLRERLSGTPRLVLAVLLLVVGTLIALTAAAPAAARPVVVTARPVAAGAVLGAGDLVLAPRVVAEQPAGALAELAPLLGQRAVAALPRGAVITAESLAPEAFSADLAAGRAVATASAAAGRAAVVRVGDVVRLVAAAAGDPLGEDATTTEPTTLATDARVLALWPTPDPAVTTLVVDVDVGAAARLAVLPPETLVGCVVITA